MAAMIDAYVLRCDHDGPYRGYIWRVENTLKALQSYVDGPIQALALTPEIVIVCNDEGKLMNLPANRGLRDKDRQIYDIVFGTFFLCGAPADSDHFTSLTPEQIEQYQKLFYTPEMFLSIDGHIVCIPMGADREVASDGKHI